MIPGLVSKISEQKVDAAATISPKTDHVLITGTTAAIATITPPISGFSSILFLTKLTAGAVTTTTSGNIATDVTLPANRPVMLIYSKLEAKWYVGAIPS